MTEARAAAEQAPGPAATAEANEHLGGALNRLIAVSEAYPQLRASENFLALQQELADIEDKLAAARRYYNQTVYRYHTVKQSFPAVLIAKPFGFREREFFGTDERDAPVVVLRAAMTLQEQIRANRWRTLWLLFLFAVLVGVLGAVLGYAFQPSLLIVVGIVGIVYGIFSWLSAGQHRRRRNRRPAGRPDAVPAALPRGRDRRDRRRAHPAAAGLRRRRPGARTPSPPAAAPTTPTSASPPAC